MLCPLGDLRCRTHQTVCCFVLEHVSGIGRLEWSNGDFYEGSFKNGMRHGNGTRTDLPNMHQQHVYSSCVHVAVHQTVGKFQQKDGRTYVGNWSLSQRDGKGKETFPNGDVYEVLPVASAGGHSLSFVYLWKKTSLTIVLIRNCY
jgi:hypothetical protein